MLLWALLALYFGLLAAASTYALRAGGLDERRMTFALLGAAAASQVASFLGQRWREGPEYSVIAVDVIFFVGTLVIVHRSRKFWPLWASAAQLVGTATHAVRFIEPSVRVEVFASIQPFWALPILVSMVVGTYGEQQRRGTDR